jgi:hypothetical protein
MRSAGTIDVTSVILIFPPPEQRVPQFKNFLEKILTNFPKRGILAAVNTMVRPLDHRLPTAVERGRMR